MWKWGMGRKWRGSEEIWVGRDRRRSVDPRETDQGVSMKIGREKSLERLGTVLGKVIGSE